MFNDVVIVQSAISAFNNAALYAPAFLWWAILSLPLMLLVWKCAPTIQNILSLNKNNMNACCGVILSAMIFTWIVLFGGNYSVLRDGVSVLPFVVAVIVFLTSLFISSHRNELPDFKTNPHIRFAIIALLLFALALSDVHTWWGPLLQVSACAFGYLMGRIARSAMRPVAGMILIILMVTIAMLMQPEFFRFGQLGNLTLIHLGCILLIGIFAMATIALNNVTPHKKFTHGTYIKLKWMMRVVSLLAMALFLLTESVPLFLIACASLLIMFTLSILHAKSISNTLIAKTMAIIIMLFGAITTMPFISALGVVYWATVPHSKFWQDFRTLL